MNQFSLVLFGLLLPWSNGFQNVQVQRNTFLSKRNVARSVSSTSPSVQFHSQRQYSESPKGSSSVNRISSLFRNRLDTISASGLKNVHTAGGGIYMFGIKSMVKLVKKAKTLPQDVQNMTWSDVKPIKRIKGLHGPITYMILSGLVARKFPSLAKNYGFWLWFAFCIKWYRARYVFKIPVWDRQPNWNNVITSKEQEKDLKAFTCKTCGSTIFIAKTREFFFEGDTGIGGLGCFSCGTKGADNFLMDRDRICEDVADIDDYFEYERPLDFISAAERRQVLKETGGDEDKANELLVERENEKASDESQAAAEAVVNGTTGNMVDDNEEASVKTAEPVADAQEEDEKEESDQESEPPAKKDIDVVAEKEMTKSASKKKKSTLSSSVDDEDMDDLDMDDL